MPRRSDFSVGVTAPDLSAVAKHLRTANKPLLKELRTRIKMAAKPVQIQAKQNAAVFSKRIPGAIGISATFPASGVRVTLRVNSKKAPHGRPIENNGRRGAFRHPVFGNRDKWVAQAARPFFFPAVDGRRREVTRQVEKVADDVIRRAGFR